MLNGIALCCDFLMTNVNAQRYHLRWFAEIAGMAIRDAVAVPAHDFLSDVGTGFCREQFFNLSGLEQPDDVTHRHFDPLKITTESIEYLLHYLEGQLVVGYELSEETRTVLDRAGVPYVDVWLHPIRFLPDNFYALRSNISSINEVLDSVHLSSDMYYLYARRLKVQSYMGWNKYNDRLTRKLHPNSALFVGQTLTDKAVCREGRMLSVLDFEYEFDNLTRQHDHVYFSRHPMIRGDDSPQIDFVKQFYNVSLIDEPAYGLLANDNIVHVSAISSSMVYEAQFFGKGTSYFYKPALSISDANKKEGYYSIYNELHKATFWSDLLSSVCQVRSDPPTYDFLESSNTYRDMLSLYYNNHVFDKNHGAFLLSKKNDEVLKKITKEDKKPSKKGHIGLVANENSLENFKEIIRPFDVVSFDIFDTLLHRSCITAGDVVRISARNVADTIGVDADKLIKARFEAKRHSSSTECPLDERYTIVERVLQLNPGSASILLESELDVERGAISARGFGKALFDAARNMGKRVVVTSDIFYSKEFIIEILQREGFVPDSYYISSELDATKEQGSLFDVVLREENGRIIHVGDNRTSDYVRAREKGIDALLIASEHDQLKNLVPQFTRSDGTYSCVRDGLIQQSLTSYPALTNGVGLSGGSAERFGYNVVGDIMMSFAAWVIEQAIADKVDTLYFLARDGEIVKKAVDIILRYRSDINIQTKYLLASRRALRVASIIDVADIERELESLIAEVAKNRNPSTTSQYLSMRFGLCQDALSRLGLEALPQQLGEFSTLEELESVRHWILSEQVVEFILDNAQKERESYLSYLRELEVGEVNVAFVDIGHNGSLQASMSVLAKLSRSRGYYFATYNAIDHTLALVKGDHLARGYYRDRADPQDKNDNYIKYALIVEALFLNSAETFIRFDNSSGQNQPCFLGTANPVRAAFNRDIHLGTCAYVDDAMRNIMSLYGAAELSGIYGLSDPCRRLFSMIKHPTKMDAQVFVGVCLENFFSGKSVRYFVPNIESLHEDDGIWQEGTRLLRQKLKSEAQSSDGRPLSPEELYFAGKYRLAAAKFEQFHSDSTPNPNALRRAAEAYLKLGDVSKGLDLLNTASIYMPKNKRIKWRILELKYPILKIFSRGSFDFIR